MATGPLVGIELRAETSRFQADMQRAANSVEGVVGRMRTSFGSLKGILAGVGVGVSLAGLTSFAKDAALAAEALGDLADVTGSSIEDLSKLSNQAKVAGGSFDEFEGALLKFTAKIGDAENVSAEFTQALKTLGVTSKDPAKALQETIAGFDKFANSATKAAYAQEIFGKSGPRFMATLADMAKLQDVAATTTTKQAEETEKLAQELRKLSVEATGVSNAILADIVPALTQLITNFRLARAEGVGFFQAIGQAWDSSSPNFDLVEKLKAANRDLASEKAKLESGNSFWNPFTTPATAESVKNAEAVVRGLEAIRVARLGGAPSNEQIGGSKPALPTLPKSGGGKASNVEKISEAQRYLDNLQQQLDKTAELGTVEKVLVDIQRGRLKLSGDVTREQLIHVAQLIDAQKELDKELEESKKLREDEAKTRERTSQMTLRSLQDALQERDNLADQNQMIREETELLGKDIVSIRAIYQARLDNLIATKEQALASRLNVTGMDAEASAMQDQINVLKERKGLLGDRAMAEDLMATAMRAKEFNDIFVNSFADGFSSIVDGSKSVSDAFKDMERQIVASITRIASQNIAESIFGAGSSSGGGGIFASIGPWFASLFGGGAPAGFAAGGSPPVGRMSLVGEKGPELFIPKQPGVIIPNDVLNAKRAQRQGNISININVPGNVSKSTADQIALQTGVAVQRALARNG
jgi:hypothetical protein